MTIQELGRLWRTVQPLKLSQLFWRLRYSARRRQAQQARSYAWNHQALPRLGTLPNIPLDCFAPRVPHRVENLAKGIFEHLNESRELGYERPNWLHGNIQSGRLWTVTLHYHQWAFDLARKAGHSEEAGALFRHYVADWITRSSLEQAGSKDLSWNAYAVATRLSWWIRSYLHLGANACAAWPEFNGLFLKSVWTQAAYLNDHIEWDLRANHLLRDAVGLAWAGRFFDEPQARHWLERATEIALAQVDEQVLADGGHFERSPMYHLHVMEDFFWLALLVTDKKAAARLQAAWLKMAEFLSWVRHPDGEIALLNDAAFNGACSPSEMLGAGKHLGVHENSVQPANGKIFAESGLFVWQGTAGSPWTVFFDVGPVGPPCQPGHAHADSLALECSFGPERLLVDAGTYAYDGNERRSYDRSTAAHNTISIDGQDSSEVWHIFRVGRRAHPIGVDVLFADGCFSANASHTGYDHLPGRPRHTRRVDQHKNSRALRITDTVDGKGSHQIDGGWLLHPSWSAQPAANGWLLRSSKAELRVNMSGPAAMKLSMEPRAYHPEFGIEIQTIRLCWSVTGNLPMRIESVVEPL